MISRFPSPVLDFQLHLQPCSAHQSRRCLRNTRIPRTHIRPPQLSLRAPPWRVALKDGGCPISCPLHRPIRLVQSLVWICPIRYQCRQVDIALHNLLLPTALHLVTARSSAILSQRTALLQKCHHALRGQRLQCRHLPRFILCTT